MPGPVRIWQTMVEVGRSSDGSQNTAKYVNERLETVSKEGWELVAASRENSHHFLFFRASSTDRPDFKWEHS